MVSPGYGEYISQLRRRDRFQVRNPSIPGEIHVGVDFQRYRSVDGEAPSDLEMTRHSSPSSGYRPQHANRVRHKVAQYTRLTCRNIPGGKIERRVEPIWNYLSDGI